jgi:casein kinase I family protein HRR25
MKRKDVKSLLEIFDHEPDDIPPVHLCDISPEDLSKYQNMRWRSIYETYADFTPMTPENIIVPSSDNVAVDWFGERGWFDELMRINRKRSAQDGAGWPSSNSEKMKGRERYLNSYWGADLTNWHIHLERGSSLTLPASEAAQLDREIDIITDLLDDESLTCRCKQCRPS